MRAIQREVAAVMVKGHSIPTLWCMASGAIHAKSAVVFIILTMASITLAGRALIHTVLMAIFAGNLGMFAL